MNGTADNQKSSCPVVIYGTAFTADDVIYGFLSVGPDETLFKFMDSLIEHLKSLGRIRTSETYKSTLNSFRRFREGRDLSFHQALAKIQTIRMELNISIIA